MIVPAGSAAFTALLAGRAPQGFTLADTPIAPPEVLAMLAELATQIEAHFSPASWLIVEQGEVVGLCSVKQAVGGVIDIGYGVAPSRQRCGAAGAAVGAILDWARTDLRVYAVTAETSIANPASQRVLERSGFTRIGERLDEEDGPLLCWRCLTG